MVKNDYNLCNKNALNPLMLNKLLKELNFNWEIYDK